MIKKVGGIGFCFLFLFSSFKNLEAQKFCVRGTVLVEGTPAANAHILVVRPGQTKPIISDTLGRFTICGLSAGKTLLKITHLSAEDTLLEIKITSHDTFFVIHLVSDAHPLKEVTIEQNPGMRPGVGYCVAVQSINAELIRQTYSPNLWESSQLVAGLRPQNVCPVCHATDIRFNGLEGSYFMLLINDVPLLGSLSRIYGLTSLPASLIENLEVTRGPASALYGPEGVAGVLNLGITPPAPGIDLKMLLQGSHLMDWNADVTARLGRRSWGWIGSLQAQYLNRKIDRNNDGYTDLPPVKRLSTFHVFTIKNKRHADPITLITRILGEDRWGGQVQWNRFWRGSDSVYAESITSSHADILALWPFRVRRMSGGLLAGASLHHQDSYYGNRPYKATQYSGYFQNYLTLLKTRKVQLKCGSSLQYLWSDDNTTLTAEPQDSLISINRPSEVWIPGLFAETEFIPLSSHRFLAGIRFDYHSIHGALPAPRFHYLWQPSGKKFQLRVGAGRAFRFVQLVAEEHAALNGSRSLEIQKPLRPESGWNTHFSMASSLSTYETSFSVQGGTNFIWIKNRIFSDLEKDPQVLLMRNAGEGLQAATFYFNGALVWKSFDLMLGTGFQNVRIAEDGQRKDFYYTEKYQFYWNAGATISKSSTVLRCWGALTGPMRLPRQGALDPRPEYSRPFTLLNISVTQNVRNFAFAIGVKNLLNFRPPATCLTRPHDPFDRLVVRNEKGEVVPTEENPYAYTFDTTYCYASFAGWQFFWNIEWKLKRNNLKK